ncbi:MAG: ABC transporter ATP-binding protein [Phycisphaerales bacterium JB063]
MPHPNEQPQAATERRDGTDQTADTPALSASGLHAGYAKHNVLHGIDVDIQPGDFAALIGPNGSGKSTLLRTLARLLKPAAGSVLLHDQPLARLSAKALACKLAVMPQSPTPPPGVSVRELVGYGRSPHTSWLKPQTPDDRRLIERLIHRCDLAHLADRFVDTLSGGERQRAWIAMALAQQPDVLLLDEPVSALDIAHQLEVLDLLAQINREQRTTIVIVLHDINLAARYCQTLFAVRAGSVAAAGPIDTVLTPELLIEVFGVRAQILRPEGLAYPVCVFDRDATV